MTQVMKKGDVVILDFNPQAGHEQAGGRPALVLSPEVFNDRTGFCIVVPITSQVKGYPFEVPITGAQKTVGVALVDQVKSLDYAARKARVVDQVSDECLAAVQALLKAILL